MVGFGPQIHWNALAFCATTLASTMMNSVFQFYYVKLFLNHYKISQQWFQTTQILYLVWNAINDPLFGYIQDNSKLAIFHERRLSILYGAPFYAFSFLLPWFPWEHYVPDHWMIGVHLLVSLCCYDTLFTFVLLAQCASFTEMSQQHDERLRLVRYSQVASVIGSSAVLWAEMVSNSLENRFAFQCYCIGIAFLSCLCMCYTGRNVKTHYKVDLKSTNGKKKHDDERIVNTSLWTLTWQIVTQKNFIFFVVMNFCQVFHLAFCSNFLAIFGDALIPQEDLPSYLRKFLYGSSFIVPQVLVLLGSGLVERFGSYKLILMSFYFKVCAALCMFMIGRSHTWVLSLFFLFDVSIAVATFSYFNISVSDIIDEDVIKHNRKSPLSSMIFGTNALFTKPAQSIAPMIVVNVLNTFNYQDAVTDGHVTSASAELLNAIFLLVCCVPCVLGLFQIVMWSRYTLRESHLSVPKHMES